ncbi:hypothetical protein [Thioalkalivibrio sp. HL-Eb18]|jgi:hypothetical protein|uniref:hypothetical protein n=1 Tax=Thioalkalivibrio sp. HL-Eb18 TaxID=1266913 RepID=UPI000379DDB9|nr:hypothetical protein [Thioalkalivibrio sp. HL-Eb18]
MPALTRAMKQMLEGLAYADLAEMQPMGDKYRSLAHEPTNSTKAANRLAEPAPQPEPRRRIGLFVGPFASRHVFDYAADSCERLDAELVVLTFLGESEARTLINGFTRDQPSLPHGIHIEALTGDPERALRRVLGRGLRLDFLVCDEQGYLGHQILGTETATELPVVMVAAPRTEGRKERRPAALGAAVPSAG